ncbi:MAG: Gfo/Idh/MocA family oxidoreductase [Ruminococcaceae bacterium]|nr:Gfo/Idh/MocA family oxidoreductase [Oscillospiraceae bacterium]
MIRFALYGCGVISGTHARALVDVEGAELIACADLNPASAETFAEKHQIQALPDWNALLQNPDIDAVCICTPSGTHAPLAIEALNAGKHVVLEKPMGLTVAQCDDIIAAAEKSNKHITVISQLRTEPDIIRAKELIESGALGKIIMAQLHMCYYRPESYFMGSWRGTKAMDGGGALMNQGIHGVDILRYLMGPVKNVQSVVRTLLHDIEVEDAAVAALEFENDAIGVITASTATFPGYDREINIYGTRGGIEFKQGTMVRLVIDGEEYPCAEFTSVGDASSNLVLDYRGHARQLTAFVRAINGEDVTYPDQFAGKQAVELVETIYKNSI